MILVLCKEAFTILAFFTFSGILDIMTNPNLTEDNALHQTIAEGDMKSVQDLVLSGAIVEEKNSRGQTPLHFAVTEYQIPIIEFLLQQGAKIDEKDTNGDIRGQAPVAEGGG